MERVVDEPMTVLEEFLKLYERSVKNFERADPIESRVAQDLRVAQPFVVHTTHLPIYGVILDQREEKFFFVHLTTFLPLASVEALKLRVKDLFDELKLTHLTFEVEVGTLQKFATPLGELRPNDLEKLKENVERLKKLKYGRLHERFFETEKKRVETILKLMREEKIVHVPQSVVRKFHDLSLRLAVAASDKKTRRSGCALIVDEELGLRLYFSDDCEGKIGTIFLLGEKIYEGTLKSGLLLRGLEGSSHYVSEETLRVETQQRRS